MESVYCAVRTECLVFNIVLVCIELSMKCVYCSTVIYRHAGAVFHFFCISVRPFSVVVRRSFPASGFEGSGLKSEPEDRFLPTKVLVIFVILSIASFSAG